MNSEGRVQYASRATFPPGDAREDWSVIRALSAVLDATLGFDNHEQLRASLIAANPIFAEADLLVETAFKAQGGKGKINASPLTYPIGEGSETSYYMTCPVSRNSVTMAECIEAFEQDSVKGAAE